MGRVRRRWEHLLSLLSSSWPPPPTLNGAGGRWKGDEQGSKPLESKLGRCRVKKRKSKSKPYKARSQSDQGAAPLLVSGIISVYSFPSLPCHGLFAPSHPSALLHAYHRLPRAPRGPSSTALRPFLLRLDHPRPLFSFFFVSDDMRLDVTITGRETIMYICSFLPHGPRGKVRPLNQSLNAGLPPFSLLSQSPHRASS